MGAGVLRISSIPRGQGLKFSPPGRTSPQGHRFLYNRPQGLDPNPLLESSDGGGIPRAPKEFYDYGYTSEVHGTIP